MARVQPVAHLQRVAGQVRKAQLVLNYAAAAGGGALLVLRHAVPLSRTVRAIEYRALERRAHALEACVRSWKRSASADGLIDRPQ